MIITISGNPGSGKTTISKILLKKLSAGHLYVGGIRRELAREMGLNLTELNEYAKTHPETDLDVDKKAVAEARKLEKEKKIVLVEGRTQYHFLPESVKLYLKVNPKIGAERIWQDLQKKKLSKERNEGDFKGFKDFYKSVLEREKNDAQRYQKYYQIKHHDLTNYDLVIDTTKITAQEAAQKIVEYLDKLKNK